MSLDYCHLLLHFHRYCVLLIHLDTSVATRRELEQIKDSCCALSCGKEPTKVVFLFDPIS